MCLSCNYGQYGRKLCFGAFGVIAGRVVQDLLDALGRVTWGRNGDSEGLCAEDVVGEVGKEGVQEEGENVRSGGGVDEVGSLVDEAAEGIRRRGGGYRV